MFFRTRQICMHVHSLGVQKRAKLGKKCVFLVTLTNFGKDIYAFLHALFLICPLYNGQIKNNACKKAYIYRVYFHTWKYVFRVYFESQFTRMSSVWNTSAPPDFNPPHDMENMPKIPIPFLQPPSSPTPPPPAVNWFQRKIYPNVDGNSENSLSHMVLCTGLPWYARNCSAKIPAALNNGTKIEV